MKAFVQRIMHIPAWVRYLLTIVIGVLLVYGWHSFIYEPLLTTEQSVMHARNDLYKQREIFYGVQREVLTLRSHCEQLNTKITQCTAGREQLSANQLIKKLITDADECGLSMAHCSPEKLEQKRWYKTEPVRFVSRGEYFDFVDILDKIKHYNCFSNVHEMNLEKNDDMLTLNCVVQTYRLE